MASGFADYAEDKVLDHVFGGAAFAQPTPYAALWIGNPGDDLLGGNEVSTVGTAYTRQAVTFAAAASGSKSNSVLFEYPDATAPYGTVDYLVIADNVTPGAGNGLAYGQLTNAKTIDTDDIFRVKVGDLTITLD